MPGVWNRDLKNVLKLENRDVEKTYVIQIMVCLGNFHTPEIYDALCYISQ